jgi:hypothetical protein
MAAAIAGIQPLEFMLRGLGQVNGLILEELKRDKPDAMKIIKLHEKGMGFARDAAPYCHPKFASITHAAQLEGPPLDLRSLNDQQLDVLILRLQRGTRRDADAGVVPEGAAQETGSD